MSNKFSEMLANASKERKAELDRLIQKDCTTTPTITPTRTGRKNKVRINLTISEETKDRLFQYAEAQGLSASVVVQMLVAKYCK